MEFSKGTDNKKLKKLNRGKLYTFSLLSGHTCPFAKDCKSMAVESGDTRRVVDGPDCKFRCFSASQEATYKDVFAQRKRNTDAVRALVTKGPKVLGSAIHKAIPAGTEVIRIHVAGDFFHKNYFLAWCLVAQWNPGIVFYTYTKALPLVQQYGHEVPDNLRITLSRGGTHDRMIPALKALGFPEAIVVFSEDEAEDMGLDIDHDDSHAYDAEASFALLIHGTQPRKVAV